MNVSVRVFRGPFAVALRGRELYGAVRISEPRVDLGARALEQQHAAQERQHGGVGLIAASRGIAHGRTRLDVRGVSATRCAHIMYVR